MKHLFVAGGSGFIGKGFVRNAVMAGYDVSVLCRSQESANRMRVLGAEPVEGDLLERGAWQQAAAGADGVVHIAQPPTFGGRVTQERAKRYRNDRLRMDKHLLEPLMPTREQRVIYVSGTSYYGNLGPELRDENTVPQPMGWGPYVIPAIEQVQQFQASGLAIIEAFPGNIYGPGSWYLELVRYLLKGNPIVTLPGRIRYGTYMHVDDCSRALLHLLEHGVPRQRYFCVDDEPSNFLNLGMVTASELNIKTRRQPVPHWLIKVLFGPVMADSARYESRLSNEKLRATGFVPSFASITQGIPDAVQQLRSAYPDIDAQIAKR